LEGLVAGGGDRQCGVAATMRVQIAGSRRLLRARRLRWSMARQVPAMCPSKFATLLQLLQMVALPLPLATAAPYRNAALPGMTGRCQDAIEEYCGIQQGDESACSMCSGLHQSPLRHAGCTHQMIMEYCREPQPMKVLGYLCTCADHCIPLLPSQRAKGQDVVIHINEDDAGRFDPMEDGRVDWDATTVLVNQTAPVSSCTKQAALCARSMLTLRPMMRCSK